MLQRITKSGMDHGSSSCSRSSGLSKRTSSATSGTLRVSRQLLTSILFISLLCGLETADRLGADRSTLYPRTTLPTGVSLPVSQQSLRTPNPLRNPSLASISTHYSTQTHNGLPASSSRLDQAGPADFVFPREFYDLPVFQEPTRVDKRDPPPYAPLPRYNQRSLLQTVAQGPPAFPGAADPASAQPVTSSPPPPPPPPPPPSFIERNPLAPNGCFNSGQGNVGCGNSGSGNIGDNNLNNNNNGSNNAGASNEGNFNIGNGNHGDRNQGDRNVGDDNTGSGNVGNGNGGNFNSGNFNPGNNNTGIGNIGNDNSPLLRACSRRPVVLRRTRRRQAKRPCQRNVCCQQQQAAVSPAPAKTDALLDSLKWDQNGLITAIVQHVDTGEVLMQAFANRLAVQQTLLSRRATFYSRSRREQWCKGDTSGNHINVLGMYLDCDKDALIYLGDPVGPSCHTKLSRLVQTLVCVK
ncbi:hypothetical protein WJX84_011384 [Apatococcus fuscideae]|uniref:phosphoribosyl-AMP cyclohydrolase n=1 Tax=Apatococcus fuscideae TaxID=2026836 RepID=A0AAW1T8M1_9CHLO